MPRLVRIAAAILPCAALLCRPLYAEEPQQPIDVGTKEKVEVRLVTVDVLVLDRDDATVPGLGKDDFTLKVDGEKVAVDTLDELCAGAQQEPRAHGLGAWSEGPDLATGTRRIIFVFDYLHLPSLPCPDAPTSNDLIPDAPCHYEARAIEALIEVLGAKKIADEEIMVAALTGGVRMEQGPTRDRDEVIRTLKRMEYDVTLYAGHFHHETARSFFEGLDALMMTLGQFPGPKALVLFTAGDGPGDGHDWWYKNLATRAAETRVALYPVDAMGLFARRKTCSACGPPGKVPGLWRLASETGGRSTQNANDMTLGYARARRDLGCRYTVGFYDRNPKEDHKREVRVDVKRDGLRVVHPSWYEFPSGEKRRESALRAAFLAPRLFEGGDVRAHLFPLRPTQAKLWDALITVDFPIVREEGKARDAATEFGVVLRNGSVVTHSLNRRIALEAKEDSGFLSRKSLTFNEHVRLAPGTYTLTVVASDASVGDRPMSNEIRVEVPPIPKKKPFIVGPFLGRAAGSGLVVNAGTANGATSDPQLDRIGAPASFRPLLVQEIEKGAPPFALSAACVVKARGRQGVESIRRWLETDDGHQAGTLDAADFTPEGEDTVRCQTFLDLLPVASMKPGPYRFAVALDPEGDPQASASQVRFSVLPNPTR